MTTKILVLSGVRHARDYLDLLQELPEFHVVGIADTDDAPDWARDDSARLAAGTHLPFLRLEEGLARCEAVLICSEPARHADLATQALHAGRHVLVDKPAATNAIEFEALAAAAATHPDLVFGTVHRLLSPAIQRARTTIDAGGIGLPLTIDAEWIASGGLDGSTVERPELVCDPALSGGGELTNFGLYPIMGLHHFTGLDIVEVMAMGGASFDGPHRSYGVEDTAVLSLLLERRVTATITLARIPAGFSAEPISSTFRILGSHGHLNVDEAAPTIRLRSEPDSPTRRTIGGPAGPAALRACFRDFATAINTGTSTILSTSDIHRALHVLDAARTSLLTREPVQLAPPAASTRP